jgi:hypothetical protein
MLTAVAILAALVFLFAVVLLYGGSRSTPESADGNDRPRSLADSWGGDGFGDGGG